MLPPAELAPYPREVTASSVSTGEPTSIAVVLTDDAVRQLAKLIWMFNRTR